MNLRIDAGSERWEPYVRYSSVRFRMPGVRTLVASSASGMAAPSSPNGQRVNCPARLVRLVSSPLTGRAVAHPNAG
jgi:hypothetical protein